MLSFGLPRLATYFLVSLVSSRIFAAPIPIVPGQQTAFISFRGETQKSLTERPELGKFCEYLRERLTSKAELAGPFREVFCPSFEANPAAKPKVYWDIVLAEDDDHILADVTFKSGKRSIKLQTLSFNIDSKIESSIAIPQYVKVFADWLTESLATGWTFTYQPNTRHTLEFDKDGIVPPKILKLYELVYSPELKIWVPKVTAILRAVGKPKKDDKSQTDPKEAKDQPPPAAKEEPQNKTRAVYKVTTRFHTLTPGQVFWVQSAEPLAARDKQYETKLKDAAGGNGFAALLNKLTFNTLSSNYSGIRYGKSLLSGQSLLSQAAIITALVEIRSGPLSGLRFYFDKAPRTELDDEFFSWTRGTMGWAFNYDIPGIFNKVISRVDIQPKIGILSLDSRFNLGTSEAQLPLTFKVKNAPDIALEIGTEKASTWFRTRIFSSFSFSQFGVSARKETTYIASTRVGLDNYLDIYKIGKKVQVTGIVFANYENLRLSKDKGLVGNDEDPLTISALSLNMFFAGLGVAVSW